MPLPVISKIEMAFHCQPRVGLARHLPGSEKPFLFCFCHNQSYIT